MWGAGDLEGLRGTEEILEGPGTDKFKFDTTSRKWMNYSNGNSKRPPSDQVVEQP